MHKAEQLRRGCTVLFHSQADHVYNRSTATGIADVVRSTFHSPCLFNSCRFRKESFSFSEKTTAQRTQFVSSFFFICAQLIHIAFVCSFYGALEFSRAQNAKVL